MYDQGKLRKKGILWFHDCRRCNCNDMGCSRNGVFQWSWGTFRGFGNRRRTSWSCLHNLNITTWTCGWSACNAWCNSLSHNIRGHCFQKRKTYHCRCHELRPGTDQEETSAFTATVCCWIRSYKNRLQHNLEILCLVKPDPCNDCSLGSVSLPGQDGQEPLDDKPSSNLYDRSEHNIYTSGT